MSNRRKDTISTGEALKHIMAMGVPADTLAEAAQVSPSTIYRWTQEEDQIRDCAVRLMVRSNLLPQVARLYLAQSHVSGTNMSIAFEADDDSLDVNDDGIVDAKDAIKAATDSNLNGAKVLAELADCLADGCILPDEMNDIRDVLNQQQADIARVLRIAEHLHANPTAPRRHKLGDPMKFENAIAPGGNMAVPVAKTD